jgi:hypothetical protein
MCKKLKGCGRKIDKCMTKLIEFINTHPNVKTIACCCGHGRYNMSIIVTYKTGLDGDWEWGVKELLSGVELGARKKYYKQDKDGYYYIPEVLLLTGQKNKRI